MKSKRAVKWVRMTAADLKPPTPSDLARLASAATAARIDTSEIPERKSLKRHGPIWRAIVAEMRRQALTGHALWKKARAFCPRIPESAVYEFLNDKRSVRVEYADAMLEGLQLRVTPGGRKKAG